MESHDTQTSILSSTIAVVELNSKRVNPSFIVTESQSNAF